MQSPCAFHGTDADEKRNETSDTHMFITFKLDMTPAIDISIHNRADKVKKKKYVNEEREARLRVWLDERSGSSPWNALLDVRSG
jgi:hypothetical protein